MQWGNALALPQCDITDFVESSWEALPSLRRGWGIEWERCLGEVKDGWEGELYLIYKMKKKLLNKELKN